MAALMRSARFCSPAVQIPKLLRVICPGTSQTSVGHLLKDRHASDQRCWRSTLVEGAEAPAQSSTKLDTMMSSIDRYMRQFGRISRKQLDPVVSCLDKEGAISVSNSLSLLRLHGSALFDETPSNRLRLADELWEKYKKHGVPLEVLHYNTLLAVYNMNKLSFSPSQFLATMEANGITPNRITYQRLIARFCDDGDIQGATQVLEHMKSASLPINDLVFNSFITGHLRSNDPDSARNILEVMRQTGLEPTSMTYTVLAVGFAERGEMEEVKKYISQAEIENVPLRPGQLLDIFVALAMSGHSQHVSELFPFLQSGTPFNQDAIRVCNQLIAVGYEDAAYQLFLVMPKPTRLDTDQTTLGRFFLRALARHQRPVDKVVEMVKDMQERELNKDNLSAVAQLAYLEGQPGYALDLLGKMKEEGLPIRAHYFWPALCQFRDASNKEGIYEVMGQMRALCSSQDDFILTLHNYTIPALLALGEAQSDIFDNMQKHDWAAEDVHIAYFLSLLENLKVQEALDFLSSHKVSVKMTSVRACVLNLVGRDVDWRTVLQILSKLKSESELWRVPALEVTAIVLRQVLIQQRKADWAGTQDVFSFMTDNGLKILRRNQVEMAEFFAGAPPEVLQRLNDLVSTDRMPAVAERPTGETIPADVSLAELKQMAKDRPNNKAVLKRLLIKACAVGDVEEAKGVAGRLEAEGFVYPPLVLVQLAFLYATFVRDLPKASTYLQQLEERFPEHQNYQTVVLKVAALQAAAGDTDGAVEGLKRYAARHAAVVQQQEVKREDNFTDILRSAADLEAAKRLMSTLTECGYLPPDSTFLLNAYMEKVVDSGDAERILQEFEEVVKTHKSTPQVDKVLQFFINKEDPDSLQKVVDILTEVHGLLNVLHHLIADFIECGHVKKARKIMETPGLRANMQRLNYYCQSFIERNMIKELEMLVEVTKDMFAVDRDNMLFHLIRGYVKERSLDKAQDVLLQYEEEMVQPSARTLRFLARSLQAAGQPVPFDVPDFQPPREGGGGRRGRVPEDAAAKTTAAAAATSASSAAEQTGAGVPPTGDTAAATQLREAVERGDVDAVMATLSRDSTILAQAVEQMKKPWPSEGLQSVFEQLGQQGNLDALSAVVENRLPVSLRNSLKAQVFNAAVNSGRGQEAIDKMVSSPSNSARYLTLPALEKLSTTAPQLLDTVESVVRTMYTERKYTEPLSILWCHYKHSGSPRADQIMKEVPDFGKNVLTGTLIQAALKENKVDVMEWLLKLKQEVGEKRGMAVAYSGLLQLYASQSDVQAVQKTCERLLTDGVERSSLRPNAVKMVEELLTEKNQPLPAWGGDTSSDSSSESDSSSSSDDEKPPQRS
ncbi:leucine-rich PPR motif-containing protein, mitochondrial-like [Babylonia areolata]|uniref:leucine-rich PPR motif-containing protein, mitochondrial-like n=1 Tax=Babylonia areolata TaxID=304850 RepID=UPI003FD45039